MEYQFTDSIKEYIAKKLDVSNETILKIYEKFFNEVKNHKEFGFEQQYLSHLIRTMECILRKKVKNPLFNIILEKLPEDDPVLDVGTAQYSSNRHFIIFYHPKLDKKQLRVCLAHELGHLFCAVLLSEEDNIEFNSEPVSTLFGIFKILDKDDFYTHKVRELCHESPEAIVDSFCQMNNRRKGHYNIS